MSNVFGTCGQVKKYKVKSLYTKRERKNKYTNVTGGKRKECKQNVEQCKFDNKRNGRTSY